MRLAVEPFLADNLLMNCCVYLLAAAWMGVRIRMLPTLAVSLFGAVYAFCSLFLFPVLREPYCKIPCFLLLSLPLFRGAGSAWKSTLFLLLSAALVGGTAVLLTLQLGGSVYADGTIVGTVPLRTLLITIVVSVCLPRVIRSMMKIRQRRSLHTEIVVRLESNEYRLDALIDSGNLLKDPLFGLPVILLDRAVDRPSLPIPFSRLSGSGVLYGERPKSVVLPQYGYAEIDCICVQAPERIRAAQAILPESLLPYDWRTKDADLAVSFSGAPVRAAANWQTRYLMVHSRKRKPAAAARSGRRSAMHCARTDR